MPNFRPGKLYQNCLKLQSASCASAGRLENPGRVHCGRDDNCSIMCVVPFHELENEVDEATPNGIPYPYDFYISRIHVDIIQFNHPSYPVLPSLLALPFHISASSVTGSPGPAN